MKFLQKIKHKKLFVLSLVGILFCSTTLYGGSSRAYAAGLQVSPTSGTEAHSMTITWNSTDFSAYGPEVDYVFFVYNNSTQKPVSGGGTGPYGLHNVAAVAASTTQSQVIGGLQPNTSYSVSYTAYARNTQKLITGGPNTDYTTQATDSQPVVVSPGPISGGGPPPSSNLGLSIRPSSQSPDTELQLRWLQVAGAIKYQVYYSSGLNSSNEVVNNLGTILSALKADTQYSVTVTALDLYNNSITSQIVSARTAANPLVVNGTCSSNNLAAPACSSDPSACKAAQGNYAQLSGNVFACYNSQTYCTQVIGGTWKTNACNNPNQNKVCAAAGLKYSKGSCSGSATTASCLNLSNIGGVQQECNNAVANPTQPPAPGSCGHSGSFFLLPTWYEYLPTDKTDCSVKFCVLGNGANSGNNNTNCTKSSIPLVLLAVVDIALRLGSLVALAFVVYGGVRFTLSQGEPDGVKSARNTILNALVGLTITIIATPLVSFLGNKFGG